MSVKEVMIGANTYIRARRKINKVTYQKYFNIEGLSDKELALVKHEAKKLDEQWALEQNQGQENEGFIGLFYQKGKFRHLRVAAPTRKTGWSVEFSLARQGQKTLYFARSIERFGFDKAYQQVFTFMVKQLGLKPRSMGTLVLKSLYYKELSTRYAERLNQQPQQKTEQPKQETAS